MNGREVKYKLKEAGYSLANIASQIGISQQNLQSKLKSKDVKIEFLLSLSKAINKNIYFFIEQYSENVNLNVNPIVNLIDEKGVVNEAKTVYLPGHKPNIMLVPIKARAGYLAGYGDPEYIEQLEMYSIPGCTGGNYRIFEVEGESMYPTFSPGDFVIGQVVTDCCDIKQDIIYIIVSRSDGIVIKRVLNTQKTADKIILYSDNPDRLTYPLIELKLSDIKECWRFYKIITDNIHKVDQAGRHILHIESEISEIKRLLNRK